ncbi:ATP-binding protein [Colwellia sp. BRX8-9]|uniref:ATP-binding protein n=1 Tax=Colwellia sp. BRX8-9 TaxID=2759831 RepID=UPI0015F6A49A|nr:ATP-binding protein [Colwellia sp. BRX8-9]MBA6348002.1 response regulator [Colwellia sp. BRX8-9]
MTIKNIQRFSLWNTISIRKKIQYSIFSFAFMVLLITTITLSLSTNSHFHDSSQRQITVLAEALAGNSGAALTFNDANAGLNILSALDNNPYIISAILYKDKQIFASFPINTNAIPFSEVLFTEKIRYEQGFYYAVAPIVVNGKRLGWLRLQSKFDAWQLIWKQFIVIFTGLLVAIVLLTLFMSYWSKRHITHPLKELSKWATRVYQHKEFSARAIKHRDDEIGQLTDSLNAMLCELSKQESILSLNISLEDEISERKKTELALIAMCDKAEQANRSKSNFLANMSHEIRTPMNSIIGFVDIVLEGDLDEVYREHLSTVRKSAKDLHNLLNDILDVAKLEEGKVELEQTSFSVIDVVNHVVKTFEISAKNKNIQFIKRIPQSLPERFIGDSLRLKQILTNLIGNAIKFTESGSITIVVDQLDSGEIQFVIRDTGIGIAKDKLAHIFENFNQADTSISRKYGGTGLGTTISKRLVQLMGGKIWLESDFGVGSTFYFTISITPTDETLAEDYFCVDTTLLTTHKSLEILVAEDVEQNAKLLCIRLEGLGHKITWVVNGLKAVETFPNKAFDIVLMDIQMPIMDGLQATKEIRKLPNGQSTPIIALTASVLHEDRKACFDAGMDGFVSKPLDFNELFVEMASLLNRQFPVTEHLNTNITEFIGQDEIPYLDMQRGINTWGSEFTYIENLKQFAQRHHRGILPIKAAITESDFEQGLSFLHALKGTAGNLALIELYGELQIMNDYFKCKNIEAAQDHLTILTHTFTRSLALINGLVQPTNSSQPYPVISNLEAIEKIQNLRELFENFQLDDLILKKLIQQLPHLNIPDELTNKLRCAVADFDFERGVIALIDIELLLSKEPANAVNL